VAKRGRPPGVTSRWRNPNNFAAHHAQTLMELWLAGVPVLGIRAMLSSLAGSPEQQALIQAFWSHRGSERRYTGPPKIKLHLCRLAVAHTVELQHDRILRQRAQAARAALRREGWTDTQITEILRRSPPEHIDFETPDLDKVLEIVSRRAPATTRQIVSLEQRPACDRKTANAAIADPSYTVEEFCAAERISRSMLYKAWAQGWGPEFYWVGVTRRIRHQARLAWQRAREAEAAAGDSGGAGT